MAVDEHAGPMFELIDYFIQNFEQKRSTEYEEMAVLFIVARYTEVKAGLVEAIIKSVELFRFQDSLVDVSPVHEFLDNHLSIYKMQSERISELEKMRAEGITEAERTLINDKDYIKIYLEHFSLFRTILLRNDSYQIQQQVKETRILWDEAEAKRKQDEEEAKRKQDEDAKKEKNKAKNARKKKNKQMKNNIEQEEAKAEAKRGEEDALEKEEKKEKLDDESVARDLILTDVVETEDGHVTVMFTFQFKRVEIISNTTFFNGEIWYPNSTVAKQVSFVPVTDDEEAKLILHETMAVIDDRLLRPHFSIYCEKLQRHLVCYDHFDGFLSEWTLSEEQKQIDEYGAPSSWCRRQIRELDYSVDHMFRCMVTHNSFGDSSSFVICGDKVKIIRVSGSFYGRDGWEFKGDIKTRQLHDYRTFIQTITDALLPEESSQKDSYLATALGANVKRYIPHTLKNHPFLMDEIYDKMQILSRGWHLHKIYWGEAFLYKLQITKDYFGAEESVGWVNDHMSAELRKIYSHEETKEGKSKYDCYSIQDLLRFLRNVYEHYMDHGMNIATIYIEIEQLWPFFIDKVYGRVITACR